MAQETTQVFQLGTYRVEFKQLLTEFQFHLHEGGDDIDDLARFFQVQCSSGNTFRHVLDKGNQALEVTDYIALNSLCLVVHFLRIRPDGNVSRKIGLFLGKFANIYTLQALDNYLNRAIVHADHTSNTRYRTNFEDIILPCLLDLGGFLRNQHNQPITAHDIIDQANRTLLAYTQRLHCKRIDNRVLERQNRQHIGYAQTIYIVFSSLADRIALFYLILFILMDGHSRITVYPLFISMLNCIWNSERWRFSQ